MYRYITNNLINDKVYNALWERTKLISHIKGTCPIPKYNKMILK